MKLKVYLRIDIFKKVVKVKEKIEKTRNVKNKDKSKKYT